MTHAVTTQLKNSVFRRLLRQRHRLSQVKLVELLLIISRHFHICTFAAPQSGHENFFPLPSEFTNHLSFPIYIKARISKYLPDNFPIKESPKQGDALSPILFNSAILYVILIFQETQERLKL
jgi:hypothetical protein